MFFLLKSTEATEAKNEKCMAWGVQTLKGGVYKYAAVAQRKERKALAYNSTGQMMTKNYRIELLTMGII